MQARFYDPTVGRFLGVDPITEGQEAFSPYHYSFNNPILYSDPDGKFPDCCGPVVEGFAQGVKEAVVRNVRAVTVDLPQTVQGMASLTTMSGQIEAAVGGTMLYQQTKSDWNTGDTRTRANIVGNVVGEIGIAVAGTKGAGNLGKAGVVSDLGKVGELTNVVSKASDASVPARTIPTVAEQAVSLSNDIGKNSVNIKTPNKILHYDLQGASHRGVQTPHVQQSLPNTNNAGQIFWNKDRKTVTPMNQQDIRTIMNFLKRQ